MLDEVDAPLDEANVTRFTRLIREMSNRSQFITITHKKRTMEMADVLYGITMEEPGCSRVVSVKLREAGHGLRMEQGVRTFMSTLRFLERLPVFSVLYLKL